jgi:hypothetical protein
MMRKYSLRQTANQYLKLGNLEGQALLFAFQAKGKA